MSAAFIIDAYLVHNDQTQTLDARLWAQNP